MPGRSRGPQSHGYPGAARWVPADPSLDLLSRAVQECRGCDLYRDATQAVPGRGPSGATVMLVGEQPGDKEDRAGEPFVGPAGRVLDEALEAAGIPAGIVYRTNVVKHFRFTSRGRQRIHKSPARWQVTACGPWLSAEVDQVRPAAVVLLGGTAGQALFGPSFRVGEARGKVLAWPDEAPTPARPPDAVVATTHPAAVLRSRHRDRDLEALVADLRVVARLLDTHGREGNG